MTIRTEHGGAKNGGGHWGRRVVAKQISKKLRREAGKTAVSGVPPTDWRDHPEGFEDGYFEDFDSEPDNGGYPDEVA